MAEHCFGTEEEDGMGDGDGDGEDSRRMANAG